MYPTACDPSRSATIPNRTRRITMYKPTTWGISGPPPGTYPFRAHLAFADLWTGRNDNVPTG